MNAPHDPRTCERPATAASPKPGPVAGAVARAFCALAGLGCGLWPVPRAAADGQWRLRETAVLFSGEPAVVRKVLVSGERQVRVHLASFSNETHTLRVVDDERGSETPGSALSGAGCLAGVNGGYFHRDRTPLGLVIAGGEEVHPFEKARLLSGVLVVDRGRVRLLRVREYAPKKGIDEALQAGPFLVDRSLAVAGLNARSRDGRTVVASDARGKLALIVTGPLTLAEAGIVLSDRSLFPELRIVRALNLDGGSSTGFWSGAAGVDLRPWKPVRNYVGIVKR